MKVLLSMVFEEGRTLSFTDYICDDGVGNGPYELPSLTRTGDKVHLDFTGSSPQAAGPINYYINENLTRMFFGIYMITVADPQILWNDGFYRWSTSRSPTARTGSPSTRPRSAAATTASAGSSTCSAGCSGRPTRRCSTRPASPPRRTSCTPALLDRGAQGEWFQLYSIGFGGIPGRPLGDGPDGHSLWPSFVNIPCEYLESYYPLRIEKWETVADTGGAGLHRGGNGVDVAYVRGARHRHPRRPLADLSVGRQRRAPAPAAPSGSSGPTAPARCCRASATTCRSRPATCCTSSPGVAAGGATRSSAIRSWWRSRGDAVW